MTFLVAGKEFSFDFDWVQIISPLAQQVIQESIILVVTLEDQLCKHYPSILKPEL